uniref:Essential protein Yae1 N-terminal domain-containing protein n=1 Tax=Kalanchoe fedtschenkoi TaxID=63787 RepID=A0A7N0UNR9_KALFE
MMGTIADELYSETLKLVNVKLDSTSSGTSHGKHPDDGSTDECTHDNDLWDAPDDLAETSDLDREWKNRREEFQTIGYRDGIIAGKEASAQEGFNHGFKESVNAGYQWGLVRGVTSALAFLPDGLKEKVMETDIKRAQLQKLYESTSSISTPDALKSFHDYIVSKKTVENTNTTPSSPTSEGLLGKYYKELSAFVKECPAINIQPTIDP